MTIVQKVEEYRAKNHRLPENMGEIEPMYSVDESGTIYYEIVASDHYIVWFDTDLGESYTYDSKEKQWH